MDPVKNPTTVKDNQIAGDTHAGTGDLEDDIVASANRDVTPAADGAAAVQQQIPESKRAQYKDYGSAISGLIHLEKTVGRQGAELGERNKAIDTLNEQIAKLEAKIATIESAPVRPSPQVDGARGNSESNALEDMIRTVARGVVEETVAPIRDSSARVSAERYTSDMVDKYGESWEALEKQRAEMVREMKSGSISEPEVWHLAKIGQLILNQSVRMETSASRPGEVAGSGLVDNRSSSRAPTADELSNADKRTDNDVLEEALMGLPRIPGGVSRAR